MPNKPVIPSLAELLDLHCETLYTFDEQGDMVADNNPFAAERRRCGRLHLGWNDEAVCYRFRHDVPQEIRARFAAWLQAHSPIGRDAPAGLDELAELFGVGVERIGLGPAYYAPGAPPTSTGPIAIDASNTHYLKPGYLQDGEIDFVQPLCALVVDGRAVSTCVTVRRASHSLEVGLDTEPEHRGQGYAGRVTAAWIAAVQAEGLIPFYSTSVDNRASQRVAEKLGLRQFAWELGLR